MYQNWLNQVAAAQLPIRAAGLAHDADTQPLRA
jgi:hypothetical protein